MHFTSGGFGAAPRDLPRPFLGEETVRP
jgi:hypothetical protein